MAEELFIPKLGQTVDEVTLIEWLVEDGTKVNFGTPILDVETDKAVFPIEANASGFLHRGPFNNGDIVPVLAVVAIIGKKDDKYESSEMANPASLEKEVPDQNATATTIPSLITISPAESDRKTFISPRAKKLAEEKNIEITAVKPTGSGGIRIAERDVIAFLNTIPRATPVAQKVADSEGINLSQVQGTGTRGIITKSDVEGIILERKFIETDEIQDQPISISPAPPPEIERSIPVKGIRGIIFDRMSSSVHTTARVTLVTETDATQFAEIREQLKEKMSDIWGFTPGYNDILGFIVVRSLKEHPYMNARLNDQGTEIDFLSSINLGMAVDTERGLLVPVIKQANFKGIQEIGREFRVLVDRARNGRSLPDDLNGGTFTITNLGMYEIDAFTPVINMPEIAILGIGRITPKVVPYKGEPAIRKMMTLSLVFDHRLVDGAPAAKFLQKIKEYIENPFLLIG